MSGGEEFASAGGCPFSELYPTVHYAELVGFDDHFQAICACGARGPVANTEERAQNLWKQLVAAAEELEKRSAAMDAPPEPSEDLTKRETEVLAVILKLQKGKSYAPTLAEIGSVLGINKITVHAHTKNMERKGYLTSRRNHARSLRVLYTEPVHAETA